MNKAIDTQAINDGLDRKVLKDLKSRFLQVNEQRLTRTRNALSKRHQLILDLLPLLFHTNHPSLPGYISHKTPARISHFEPDKQCLQNAQHLARSFRYHSNKQQTADIYSLFIMGSVGTVAHSERSDLDCWLCHRPGISTDNLDMLQHKAKQISRWALDQGLEVHFFLMDCDAFRTGQRTHLDKESSGSAQHYLLLDEFYRTAIWLAGRHPLWWYVPAECEHEYQAYANTLLNKRFLNRDHILDFGHVARIPSEEFIGASIWQLYKAIESPHKSVLKLLVLECYTADYTRMVPLCLDFKRSIYQGDLRTEQLDGYVMIYRRLEAYLQNQRALDRLDLVRRCFYIKVNKRLTKPLTSHTKSWQRTLLEEMVESWGWTRRELEHLDRQNHWKVQQVVTEYQQLVKELTASYRSLITFAKAHADGLAINTRELNILGRKLKTTFGRETGKVDWINLNISGDMSEPQLLFAKSTSGAGGWQVNALPNDSEQWADSYSFKRAPSLLELLLWCYCNGIATSETRLLPQNENLLPSWVLKQALVALQNWLPLPMPAPAHNTFSQPAKTDKLLVMINLANKTHSAHEHIITASTDPLNYSGDNHNLVQSIEVINKSTWQEVRVTQLRYRGHHHDESANAVIGLIQYIVERCLLAKQPRVPETLCRCLDQHYGKPIEARVSSLISQLNNCFFHSADSLNNRFLITLAGQHYLFFISDGALVFETFSNPQDIVHYMSKPTREHRALFVDEDSLIHHPLSLLALYTRNRTINVLYYVHDKIAELFVIDERNTLTVYQQPYVSPKLLLRPLHQFIRHVLNTCNVIKPEEKSSASVYPVEFFAMSRNHANQWEVDKRIVTTELEQLSIFTISVQVGLGPQQEWMYRFDNDGKHFDQAELGAKVFHEVAASILDRRANREAYPCHISAVDISPLQDATNDHQPWQTSQYLQLKLQLEQRLNQAMTDILDQERAAG